MHIQADVDKLCTLEKGGGEVRAILHSFCIERRIASDSIKLNFRYRIQTCIAQLEDASSISWIFLCFLRAERSFGLIELFFSSIRRLPGSFLHLPRCFYVCHWKIAFFFEPALLLAARSR